MSNRSRSQPKQPTSKANAGRRSPKPAQSPHGIMVAIISAIGLVAAAAVSGIALAHQSHPDPLSATVPTTSASPATPFGTLVRGDGTKYVKDLNYPDMTSVTVGQHFTKKWLIRNTGKVSWADRYLVPDGQPMGTCIYPPRVRIPDTKPAHSVVVSVPVTAASTPQLCMVTWKMATPTGQLYFPGYKGIWFEVRVVRH